VSLRVVVEADGGSRGNPGPSGYGAVVLDASTGAVLAERGDAIGIATNNVAEYRGLIAGLDAAAGLGATDVEVRMDSKLVVEQMTGRWQIKHPSMIPLAAEASALAGRFATIAYNWVPREQNGKADALVNRAIDAGSAVDRDLPPAVGASAVGASAGGPSAPSWAPPVGAATRLVLVRHGSTIHSGERRLSGRNSLPLTEIGNAQARALANRMSALHDVAAVISSPLLRTRQTADHIASALGLGVHIEDGFQEVDFGDWEGSTFAELIERDSAAVAAWSGDPTAAPPGGESFAQLAIRLRPARDKVVEQYTGRTVIVVSHVTPIKMLLVDALGAPLESLYRVFLDPASVSIVDHSEGRSPSVRLINGTSHLPD
jgi:broad specificity phosphatase PhoE/ribonuclease HI